MTRENQHFDDIHEVVACVICGYAHGGTTFFSRVVSAHPQIFGGFECGIMMAETPSEILDLPPHMLRRIRRHWGVGQQLIQSMAAQSSFREAYEALLARSRRSEAQVKLFDKFPGYVKILPDLADRVDVPVLVVARDPRAVYWSIFRKQLQRRQESGVTGEMVRPENQVFDLEKFSEDYVFKYRQILKSKSRHPDRIAVFQLEKLVMDFETQRRRVFSHLKLQLPSARFGARNVPETKVRPGLDISVIDDYRNHLAPETCERILEMTDAAKAFHVPLN